MMHFELGFLEIISKFTKRMIMISGFLSIALEFQPLIYIHLQLKTDL